MTNSHKMLGQVYTPDHVARFIVERVFSSTNFPDETRVLEPSVGGGVFLDALLAHMRTYPANTDIQIDAFDLDEQALRQSKTRFNQEQRRCIKFEQRDFVKFSQTARRRYDLVIGNPPYVSRRVLSPETRAVCGDVHKAHGLDQKANHNLWGAFLVAATGLLTAKGILAFVLPEEFLNVRYAQELREHVEGVFARTEIYSTNFGLFADVDQKAIIMICYKQAQSSGTFFSAVRLERAKVKASRLRKRQSSSEFSGKWCDHLVTSDESALINKLLESSPKISDLSESSAGIVTAANDYFIVDDQTAEAYDLSSYCKPIIQKGAYVNGATTFTDADFVKLGVEGRPRHLLDLANIPENQFNDGLRAYLKVGEEAQIPNRFKCRQRDRWFDVPGVRGGQGYFFKRGHDYPKLISNNAGILATDSAYRVDVKPDICLETFVSCFYNSFTLVCAELFGRSYGGGVLELTPKEFRRLPVPYTALTKNEIRLMKNKFDGKKSIARYLDDIDRDLLGSFFDLSSTEIGVLQSLRQRLVDHRTSF